VKVRFDRINFMLYKCIISILHKHYLNNIYIYYAMITITEKNMQMLFAIFFIIIKYILECKRTNMFKKCTHVILLLFHIMGIYRRPYFILNV